jgi:hypothetical protein
MTHKLSARNFRISVLLVALVSSLPNSYGQSRPPEVLTLVDQANALPAEFRADILLRIASSSKLILEPKWKKELIEDAYWSAAHATLPYTQVEKIPSDAVAVNSFRTNRLEALSLQSKAIEAMLAVDSVKALGLFEQLPPMNLPKLACSSAVTPNLAEYYQVAINVFERSFTRKQRANGDDFNFLQRVIGAIDTPSQVVSGLEMILFVNVSVVQRHDLLILFASRLHDISRSDREYGATELGLELIPEKIKAADATILLPALRSYIVRHVSGNRCSDNIPNKGKLPLSVAQFNSLARGYDPEGSRYKPISMEEAEPSGVAGDFLREPAKESAVSKAITEDMRWLTHHAEPSSKNWHSRYDETAKLVHDLNEDDEDSTEAFFCAKAQDLNLLATLLLPGQQRDRAMDEYREFMEEYYSSIQNPNLWFTMFRHMLYTARFSEDPETKAWILNKLASSNNPVMSLYARLELQLGPPAQTYPVLHVRPPHRPNRDERP